jgi:hypothetical protein
LQAQKIVSARNIRGLRGEPVSTGSVNGAIRLDDYAILAECERKQHRAKNAHERESDVAQLDDSSPPPNEIHR